MTTPNFPSLVARELDLSLHQIDTVLELTAE